MINKFVSLLELVKLKDNEELSERYVNYLCGFGKDHKYRHDEIVAISQMIELLSINADSSAGFLYEYQIPQLNKEFDLIKVTTDLCLNIEIKSHNVPEGKIIKQLLGNKHFLGILNIPIKLFSFNLETKTFYELTKENNLKVVDEKEVASLVNNIGVAVECDFDIYFQPKNILISPLNDPEKFYDRNYLLTEYQDEIQRKIINGINYTDEQYFYGLTGGPGTGKTLLLYDIAFDLARNGKSVLVVHSGIMCQGHNVLNSKLETLKIISAKDLRYREIRECDVILVDEAQRIYTSIIDKMIKWVKKTNKKCVFSFDESQTLSKLENKRQASLIINNLCTADSIFKLTNKIRTNKEIAIFITCLKDITKYKEEYRFQNVSIIFEKDNNKSVILAKEAEKEGYKYISYTPSFYDSSLKYQESDFNTHRVIGQEFDGVVMILNDRFYYESGALKAFSHPNSDYLYTQLLYQGLTRARTKLRLIVQTEELLENIMILFGK